MASLPDWLSKLFDPSSFGDGHGSRAEQLALELSAAFLKTNRFSSDLEFSELISSFKSSRLPQRGSTLEYVDFLGKKIVPHSLHSHAPRCLGHMTNVLPHFVHPIAHLMLAMNQNMVRGEASKALTPFERQTLAILHRLVFGAADAFYDRHVQDSESSLGVMTSGGTLANIAALWCARNEALGPKDEFAGIEVEGLVAALAHHGFKDAVVVGSSLMHYSLTKAVDLLGLGTRNLLRVPVDAKNHVDVSGMRQTLLECREKRRRVLAVVGVAGTTDAGSVDPLARLAELCREFEVHFHVDAAWGGPLLFSDKHRAKLKGVELADTVTLDAHKHMHLPLGIGMLMFRDPKLSRRLEMTAEYTIRKGSHDLGRRSIETSRAASTLFLHAGFSIIGLDGYGQLIDDSMQKTQYFVSAVKKRPGFELLCQPEVSIVLYRYVQESLREKSRAGTLSAEDQAAIGRVNEAIQKVQRRRGNAVVGRTALKLSSFGDAPVVALRAVLANPLVRHEDIDWVLDEQSEIARSVSA